MRRVGTKSMNITKLSALPRGNEIIKFTLDLTVQTVLARTTKKTEHCQSVDDGLQTYVCLIHRRTRWRGEGDCKPPATKIIRFFGQNARDLGNDS